MNQPADKPLVIIVQGSPRSDGNSALLALDAFDACEKAGVDALIVSACALMEQATACNGCMTCVATGHCAHDDEVSIFIEMLDQASGLLWISPVYFSSIPGGFKQLIDRLQVFWARRERGEVLTSHQRRPACALVVGSGADPFGVKAVTLPLTSASNVAEFTLKEPTVLLGLEDTDALQQVENAAKRAHAGETIASLIENVRQWEEGERQADEEFEVLPA